MDEIPDTFLKRMMHRVAAVQTRILLTVLYVIGFPLLLFRLTDLFGLKQGHYKTGWVDAQNLSDDIDRYLDPY